MSQGVQHDPVSSRKEAVGKPTPQIHTLWHRFAECDRVDEPKASFVLLNDVFAAVDLAKKRGIYRPATLYLKATKTDDNSGEYRELMKGTGRYFYKDDEHYYYEYDDATNTRECFSEFLVRRLASISHRTALAHGTTKDEWEAAHRF